MKIMIISPYLSGKGGMETVLLDVAQYLNINSNEFTAEFLFPQGVKENKFLNSVDNIHANKLPDIRLLRQTVGAFQTLRSIGKTDADIIICMSTRLISIVNFARKLFKKIFKLISWIHFSLYHEQAVNISDLVKADFHFAISSEIASQMIENGISKDAIFTIFNPIKSSAKKIDIKTNTDFIYIARLQYEGQKNFKSLINAARIIDKDFKIHVYGDGSDNDIIVSKIKALGLSDRFIFNGWESNPWSKINQGTALLLCSKYEGFPTVLGESIARGLPVISSDCPTGPKDIVNKNNGFLYNVDDDRSLADIMSDFIDGKFSFSTNQIKSSIDDLYEKSYYKKLKSALYTIYSR